MIRSINNVSFGALNYNNMTNTRDIIKSEFNTPKLREIVQDVFKKIDEASSEKGVDLMLEANDYSDSINPAARAINVYMADDYTISKAKYELIDSLAEYWNGSPGKNRSKSEAVKMRELNRFSEEVLTVIANMTPGNKGKLESCKRLFD